MIIPSTDLSDLKSSNKFWEDQNGHDKSWWFSNSLWLVLSMCLLWYDVVNLVLCRCKIRLFCLFFFLLCSSCFTPCFLFFVFLSWKRPFLLCNQKGEVGTLMVFINLSHINHVVFHFYFYIFIIQIDGIEFNFGGFKCWTFKEAILISG